MTTPSLSALYTHYIERKGLPLMLHGQACSMTGANGGQRLLMEIVCVNCSPQKVNLKLCDSMMSHLCQSSSFKIQHYPVASNTIRVNPLESISVHWMDWHGPQLTLIDFLDPPWSDLAIVGDAWRQLQL